MEVEKQTSQTRKELWTIDELEDASGLTKRTIKYYVQLGLISPAIGETRSARYTASHLQIQEMKPRADDVIPKKRKVASPHLFLEFYLGQGVYLKFDNNENKFEETKMKELAVKMSELLFTESTVNS